MTTTCVSRYPVPRQLLRYDAAAIAGPLIEAKTAARCRPVGIIDEPARGPHRHWPNRTKPVRLAVIPDNTVVR